MRLLLVPAALLLAAPAAAEGFSSTVLRYDPESSVLVLRDHSILHLSDAAVPSDLGAGDVISVVLDHQGYDGIVAVESVTRID